MPLSVDVYKRQGVHIHIIDAELMGKGEKEKKDLYIEGVQNNGIINNYEYIINSEGTIEIRHVLKPEGKMVGRLRPARAIRTESCPERTCLGGMGLARRNRCV